MGELFKSLLNLGTIAAFIFSAVGISAQTLRIRKRRSAEDISIIEVTLRTAAGIILCGKIFIVHDVFLTIGASLLFFITITYFFTVLGYYPRQRRKYSFIIIAIIIATAILVQWKGDLLLSVGSLAAWGFFVWGIAAQVIKVTRRKSSDDISLVDVSLRSASNIVLLVKYISTHDYYLISGSITLVTSLVVYLPLVTFFRLKKKN